jgi:hypothetical protein
MQGALIIQTLMKLPEEHNTIVVSRFVTQKSLYTFQYENFVAYSCFSTAFWHSLKQLPIVGSLIPLDPVCMSLFSRHPTQT